MQPAICPRGQHGKVLRTGIQALTAKRIFILAGCPPSHFFCEKEVYEQAGQFNLSLRSAADYELMLRVLLKHEFSATYISPGNCEDAAGGMSNASLGNRLRANKEDRLAWKLNGLEPYFFTLYVKPLERFINIYQVIFMAKSR